MNNPQNNYDIILIGSGMGALTVASLMSQLKNKRVLVLEQHYVLGGFTHTFKRGKAYKWDVGIHYVGDLEDGHLFRSLFDYTTQGGVKWTKMPYIYDKFVFPEFTFECPADEEDFKERLIQLFPHEKAGIIKYLKDIRTADSWYRKYLAYKHAHGIFKPFFKPSKAEYALSKLSTREYLNETFTDERIRGLLTSQWGDYGAVPKQSSFVNHAMVAVHFLKGGYYPLDSSKKIVESIKPIVEKAGGEMLINHTVKEIIVKDNKAIGVKATHKKGNNFIEKEFYAPVIVSNVGAYNTYANLLPKEYCDGLDKIVENHEDGLAHVCLYIGFKESPRKLGFNGENHWIFDEYNHDEIFSDINAVKEKRMKMAFLSFPSLKDPNAKADTGEIITFVDYNLFKKWATEAWKNRGEDYEAVKEDISQHMLDFIENKYPGFKDLVDIYELSTPLTTEHFTKHKKGAIYGMLCSPDRLYQPWNHVKTPIKNLYLTGTDAAVLGVAGAFTGGIFTTLQLLGGKLNLLSYVKLLSKANAYQKKLKKENKTTVVFPPNSFKKPEDIKVYSDINAKKENTKAGVLVD